MTVAVGAAATGGDANTKLSSMLSADKTEVRTVERLTYDKVEFKVPSPSCFHELQVTHGSVRRPIPGGSTETLLLETPDSISAWWVWRGRDQAVEGSREKARMKERAGRMQRKVRSGERKHVEYRAVLGREMVVYQDDWYNRTVPWARPLLRS